MKHPLLLGEIQKKSLELATIIFAQTAKAAEPATAGFPDFSQELDQYYFNELHAKAVELAVNMRRMDEGGSMSPAWVQLCSEVSVARPIGHFSAPSKDALTIRDACNKIIHADTTRLHEGMMENRDANGMIVNRQPCWTGEVTLSSNDPRNSWNCSIDLLAFSQVCFTVVSRWLKGEFQRMP